MLLDFRRRSITGVQKSFDIPHDSFLDFLAFADLWLINQCHLHSSDLIEVKGNTSINSHNFYKGDQLSELPVTVNRLYNDIRFNSKTRYNVNCLHKNQRIVHFFIDSPMLFFRKIYVFDICKNRLAEAIQTNTQNV